MKWIIGIAGLLVIAGCIKFFYGCAKLVYENKMFISDDESDDV